MAKTTELDAAIDTLLKNYKTPEEIIGENGLLQQLTKAVLQRALQAEMTLHLGHEKHASVSRPPGVCVRSSGSPRWNTQPVY